MSENNERLSEILRQLNDNQLRYLSVRPFCSSKKEAAEAIGLVEGTVYQWPEIVDEALELMRYDGVIVAGEILRRSLPKAAAVKAAGLDSAEERTRQDVATEILDRHLGKPTQRSEINANVNMAVKGYVNVSPDDWDAAEES